MDLSWTGTTVLIAFATISISILFVIIIFKIKYKKTKRKLKPTKTPTHIQRDSRSKYKEFNVFLLRKPMLLFGTLCAFAFILSAFNYTSFTENLDEPLGYSAFEDIDIPILPPRTEHFKPPPPPPPLPVFIPEEIVEPSNEPDFVDYSVDATTEIETIIETKNIDEKKFVPLPPPMEDNDIVEIVSFVEEMPRFPGCEEISGSILEKKKCAQEKMLAFIYKNTKYPTLAKEVGLEGQVVIRFVINQNGRIGGITLLRGLGAGCSEAALAAIKKMSKLPENWIPGKQRGRAVKVYYTLPIRFKLQ